MAKDDAPANNSLVCAIIWSCLACVTFGFENFGIGYTNVLPGTDLLVVIGLLWVSSGICGLILFLANPRNGIFFSDSDTNPPRKIETAAKVASVIGGIAVGFSFMFMKLAFDADPKDQGPLDSVICADVILVSVLCHFLYDERLSRVQWVAVLLVSLGLAVMVLAPGETHPASTGHGTTDLPVPQPLLAFLYAFFAMLCFGTSVFTIRIATVGHVAPLSGLIARMLVIGVCGLAVLYVPVSSGLFG